MSPNVKPQVFYGWYVVAGTFVMLFAAFGVVYSFGAFFLALSMEFQATRAAVATVFSYCVVALFSTGAISGMLADRFGPKRVMAIGIAAIMIGLFLAARARALTEVSVCFTFGVGIGVGFVYVPAISAVQRWFERRRGLASGIAVTGIGMGTLCMPVVAGWLLETQDWRFVFVCMACVVGAAGVVAILLVEADPAKRGLIADGALVAKPPPGDGLNIRLAPMVRSRPFIQYYLAGAVLAVPIFVPFVHLVAYAEDIGIGRPQAVGLLSLIGLGSVIGRFAVGGFADRFGRRETLILLLAGIALSYLVWIGAQTIVALSCFAVGFGICYGGYVALSPALIADYFSGPKLSSVIGLQYTSSALGSLIGPVLAGYLFDVHGNYTIALVVSGFCGIAASCMVLTMPRVP